MTGLLILAAFVALVIVVAGMPVGLFAPARTFGDDCPDCHQPMTSGHTCTGGTK